MNWKFWGKPPKESAPPKERLYIPSEHIEKVLELNDAYHVTEWGDSVARFRLWRIIYAALDMKPTPDSPKYKLCVENATFPYIVEIDEKD